MDIIPTEDAPIDERGHRAEVIMDDKSTIKRMNLGRLYEMYFNGTITHIEEDIKVSLGFEPRKRLNREWYLNRLTNESAVVAAFQEVMEFYRIAAPAQFDTASKLAESRGYEYMLEHLSYVLSGGIRPRMPVDNPVDYVDAVRKIEKRFKPLYKPVQYRGKSGNLVRTKDPVRIANMYIMLLEKVADDWAAVSSSKRQHYGVPAKISNFDRYSSPSRQQPTRATGESESRNYSANVSPRATADMIDRSTNPTVHRQVCESILSADKPTSIISNVDRDLYPIGYGRIQMFIKHIMECDGLKLVRYPTNPNHKE